MRKITTAMALCLVFWGSTPVAAEETRPPAPDSAVSLQAAGAYIEQARDVIFYALSMVGIRYVWGGTSPQAGFDCSGLVSHVYRQIAGLVLPRDSYGMARLGMPVGLDDLMPGDLVFFNTLRRPFSHVGIYLGDKRFVHAPAPGKSVNVVDMRDPYWAARFDGARRIGL
jgi:cell wall-associated NlpC family hydrolase